MPPEVTSWVRFGQRHAERLAGLLLLAGVAGALWFGPRLSLAQQVLLWGGLLIGAAVVLRRGWLKLFGPVLFYDLLRSARRGRYFLMRILYALFLLLILLSVYTSHIADRDEGIAARQMAAFASSFFAAFMSVQYLAVLLLTPAYTAGAVAEERERKTLEFLLATDLQNREIVLSKQLSRLANMTLLILAGLPILAVMQFLGGVAPDLVLAGFAATGLTMLGLSSLSLLCSIYSTKPRNAIVLTYLVIAAYLALSGILSLAHLAVPSFTGQALTWGEDPILVQDLVEWFSVANPIVLLVTMGKALSTGLPLSDFIPAMLRNYAIFFGVVTAGCTGWAVLRLRAVALKQTAGKAKRLSRRERRRRRPYLGHTPMVWKEVRLDPGLQFNWPGRLAILVLIIGSFVPPVWIGVYYYDAMHTRSWRAVDWREVSQAINIWVRMVGTLVACLTLLGVAVRASGSISGERDRQTWDSLLTTPLDSDAILHGKWSGSICSVRWGWVWLGLIWGAGVATGALSIFGLLGLLAAWTVFAAFLTNLGLFCSIYCRTTLRANIMTVGLTIALAVGHWLPTSFCVPFIARSGNARMLEHLYVFQAFALTPPATLAGLAFQESEFERHYNDSAYEMVIDCVVGLALWGVGALILWIMTSQRLRRATGRQQTPYRPRPRLEQPKEPAEPADVNFD